MVLNLKLKILWHEKFLGLAILQNNKKTSIPFTTYYFWPKTAAWEQLKLDLDSKFWLPTEEKIKVLNAAAGIMNYWKKNRKSKDLEGFLKNFDDLIVWNLVT